MLTHDAILTSIVYRTDLIDILRPGLHFRCFQLIHGWIHRTTGQSNVAISGIAANWKFRPPKSPLCEGLGPCLIQCYLDHISVPAKWYLIPSNGFCRVHECDRRHIYRTRQGNACRNRLRYFFHRCRLKTDETKPKLTNKKLKRKPMSPKIRQTIQKSARTVRKLRPSTAALWPEVFVKRSYVLQLEIK